MKARQVETDFGPHIPNRDYNGQLPCEIQEGEMLSCEENKTSRVNIVTETSKYEVPMFLQSSFQSPFPRRENLSSIS